MGNVLWIVGKDGQSGPRMSAVAGCVAKRDRCGAWIGSGSGKGEKVRVVALETGNNLCPCDEKLR